MGFEGKSVWITGASSGVGAALAREWAGRGARVILSGRDEARLNEVAASLATETLVLPFDVRDEDAMREATARATQGAGVDIFVANAGVSQRSPAVDTAMQVYRDIIDIDLTAQIAATQALLPHLTQRGSGKLVFISSVAGKVGVPLRTAYCAAKFGLIGYAIVASTVFTLGRGLDVWVRGGEVRSLRRWLGIPLVTRKGQLLRAEQVVLKTGMSSTSNGRQTEYMTLIAEVDGKKIRLAEGIAGREAGEALREAVLRTLRLV